MKDSRKKILYLLLFFQNKFNSNNKNLQINKFKIVIKNISAENVFGKNNFTEKKMI